MKTTKYVVAIALGVVSLPPGCSVIPKVPEGQSRAIETKFEKGKQL